MDTAPSCRIVRGDDAGNISLVVTVPIAPAYDLGVWQARPEKDQLEWRHVKDIVFHNPTRPPTIQIHIHKLHNCRDGRLKIATMTQTGADRAYGTMTFVNLPITADV